MNEFCTYLTTYSGNKFPPFYIGSTSVKKVNEGYHGSVSSRKYSEIWNTEIKTNPHLFSTEIIAKYESRQSAIDAEYDLQKLVNAPKNPEFVNMAYASGTFGGPTDGENNPFYGKKHSLEVMLKMRSNRKDVSGSNNAFYGKKHTDESIRKMLSSNQQSIPIVIDGIEYPSIKYAARTLGISRYFALKMSCKN